jgi:hypothetical protein
LERVWFVSEAGGDFAIHHSLKGKCLKNCYWFFFLCALFFEMVFHGKLGGLFKCEHCSFQELVQWCCVL